MFFYSILINMNTTVLLILGLIVCSVCAILSTGGGIGAYFLLKKEETTTPTVTNSSLYTLPTTTTPGTTTPGTTTPGTTTPGTTASTKLPPLPPPIPGQKKKTKNTKNTTSTPVKYGDRIHIARHMYPNYRLYFYAQETGEDANRIDDPFQLEMVNTNTDGTSKCIKYNDILYIQSHTWKDYRLRLYDGKATSPLYANDTHVLFMIKSVDGKSGCVNYGDKIHIVKQISNKHKLHLYNGKATEVYDQSHEPTQLVIQKAI
jgi:hypothetical protein